MRAAGFAQWELFAWLVVLQAGALLRLSDSLCSAATLLPSGTTCLVVVRPWTTLWLILGAVAARHPVVRSCCLSAVACNASYSVLAPGLQVQGLSREILVLY